MQEFLRRTWASINLDALNKNFCAIRNATNPCAKIMSVIKADAYGHGALPVANELISAGTDWFAVSNLDEALQLRRGGVEIPILILGYTPPEFAKTLALNDISQAVFNMEYGELLAKNAVDNCVEVNVHIKIDTGMSRIGFSYQDNVLNSSSIDEIETLCRTHGLYSEGVFTHLARADEPMDGEVFTRVQFDLFLDAISRLENRGIHFDYRHCCNSAGIEMFPEMHLDMVRPGIILYGLSPSDFTKTALDLSPVMELKTVVSMLKNIPAQTPISYGGTFVSPKDMTIATVPIGYADGYYRRLSNNAFMLVNGEVAPIIGRVCMDQTVLDVSDIANVENGMTVTVFGTDNGQTLFVDDLALRLDTINYELVCAIGMRVPRVYTKGDEIISVIDYLD
ncbi:MAG: alanine racemase [Acutalibacteraceae bacterium]